MHFKLFGLHQNKLLFNSLFHKLSEIPSYLIYKKILLIYLQGRVGVGRFQGEETFHLPIHSQMTAIATAGPAQSQSCFQVSYWAQWPKHLSSLPTLSHCISRELNQKWSIWDLNCCPKWMLLLHVATLSTVPQCWSLAILIKKLPFSKLGHCLWCQVSAVLPLIQCLSTAWESSKRWPRYMGPCHIFKTQK